MKYTGLGFKLDLDSFEIKKNNSDEINLIINNQVNNNIKFSLFDVGEYKLAIASKYTVKEAIEINVDDL